MAETLGAAAADLATIASRVAQKRTLLLVDNIEQLLPDAATVLAELVAAAPALRLLVTSREALRIQGEEEFDLRPLDEEDAAELFVARARAVRPGFERNAAVDELCERLDRLPLAVELAAARMKVLTPEQILGRLSTALDLLQGTRDAEHRHATLRATIGWSYELLDDDERRLSRSSPSSGRVGHSRSPRPSATHMSTRSPRYSTRASSGDGEAPPMKSGSSCSKRSVNSHANGCTSRLISTSEYADATPNAFSRWP